MKKRFFMVTLTVCLIIALLPMMALANGNSYWTDEGNYETDWYTDSLHTGLVDDPYLISTSADLAGLAVLVNGLNEETATDFSGLYIELADNIDLADHSWTPIGTVSIETAIPFSGIFDGNGKTVTGLTVPDRGSYDYAGLFGYTENAIIQDLAITECSVMGGACVGGLVGQAHGTSITDCQVSGVLRGYNYVGGLVGYTSYDIEADQIEPAAFSITNSSFTGTVIGDYRESQEAVGGLVGESQYDIENCFASARVSGNDYVGGLVGRNLKTINGSYATGDAVSNYGISGGLVGCNAGVITASYATGDAYGTYFVGGLVGVNEFGSEIENCYAIGDVFSQWNPAGGLVGYNDNSAIISKSYATGDVTSNDSLAAGIVGVNEGGTVVNCVALSEAVTGNYVNEITAYNSGSLTNNRYLEDMDLTGDWVGYEAASVTAADAVTPVFYSEIMSWDVYGVAEDPIWYCVDGTYPQLAPITEVTVTLEGADFEVFAGDTHVYSGDTVFTGTKLEIRSTREGYAVSSFVLKYEELTPLDVDSSTRYESISGDSFILRDDVTIQNVEDEDQVLNDAQGDIWVWGGYYTLWGSEDLNDDGTIDEYDFFTRFAVLEDFYATAHPIDPGHPITSCGVAVDNHLYQIDDGLLYLGDLNLGTGSFYGFGDEQYIDLESGTLRAAEIDIPYELWFEKGTTTIVKEDITAGYEIYSYGCNLEVGGDITATDEVYFDSDCGPLFVTVHGDIITEDYGHSGGSVRVDGSIMASDEIYCDDDYADHNATELSVGNDLIASYEDQYIDEETVEPFVVYYGGISIGYEDDMMSGSLDAAAVDTLSMDSKDSDLRHPKKGIDWATDEIETLNVTDPLSDLEDLDLVTVTVNGDMIAGQVIEILGGNVDVDGAIKTLSVIEDRTIYLLGGKITAGSIKSATDIYVDEVKYESNIHVMGDMAAQDEIGIYSGRVDVDGAIRLLDSEGDTIYIVGGTVIAADIVSATDIFIGQSANLSFDSYDDISVKVANSLDAANSLYLYDGMISAGEVSFGEFGTFIIEDAATLLDAVNNGRFPPRNSELILNDLAPNMLQYTIISGLIPGALTDITITNASYSGGSKSFTAPADEYGCIYVWLLVGEWVEGTATFDGYGQLTAEDIIDMDSAELEFSPEQGDILVTIGLTVPDEIFNVFGSPWDTDPFDPAGWTFTNTSDGTAMEDFSVDANDCSFTYFRNGEEYEFDGLYLAGDYTVYVSTVKTIGEEPATNYIAAGSANFTIDPAIVTVQAKNHTVLVGSELPEFTMTIVDPSGLLEEFSDVEDVFYSQCFGTTDTKGSYPIYVRMDCYNDYYLLYQQAVGYLEDSVGIILDDGVLTVRSASTSSGGGSLSIYYDITATAGNGGSITPSGSISVKAGSDKTFTITPDTGYKIADVLVNGVSVGAVSSYTLENISKDSTIKAQFALIGSSAFTDVPAGSWYYEAVNFVVQRGLFNGTSDTTFEPSTPVTRAMFVTILGRLHNVDQAAYPGSSFSDVPTGEWYSPYVEWAAKNGIVTGYAGGKFGPNDKITREALCAILSRYCDYAGIELPQQVSAITFSDNGKIGDWAKDYIKTIQMADLVRGMDNNLFDPQGNADRAQVATILMRLILNVIEA